MASRYVTSSKAGQGRFYFGDQRKDFKSMITYMKSYAAKRAKWVDARLLAGYRPPPSLTIAAVDAPASGAPSFKFSVTSKTGSQPQSVRWRLAEITDPAHASFDPKQPWKYEINAIWETQTNDFQNIEIPSDLLKPGHIYRVRARWQQADGRWSRWSRPAEFEPKGV
jgi:hypothetical protein